MSYDNDFFIDIFPWYQEMFFIPITYIYVTDAKRGPDETPDKTTPTKYIWYIMVSGGLYGFSNLTTWF